MFLIAMMIIFSVICGFMAQSKNRRVGVWMFLGAIFGLISMLVLLMLEKLENTENVFIDGVLTNVVIDDSPVTMSRQEFNELKEQSK